MRRIRGRLQSLLRRLTNPDPNLAIVDNLTLSVIVLAANRAITYVSPYTEVLTGYSVKEIEARGYQFLREIMHPDYHERFDRSLQFGEAGEPYQFQHSFTHKTGIDVWAETRTSPLTMPGTSDSGLLMVTLNISQQMVYQRQVEVRTREVEDFTYMVSHDLKAPLFTMKGMLDLLEEEVTNLSPQGKEMVEYLHRAASRLETLIGSVLTYAKVTSTSFPVTPVPLDTVIDDLLNEYAPPFKEHGVTCTVHRPLPTVEGEPSRLRQVFGNLISNAIKYRDPNRPLILEIGALPTVSRRNTTIYVRDTACGIPEAKKESIFRPFHRNHGSEIEGTGIGLACVKRLVEKCGGEVELDSEVGKGSTFLLTFRQPALVRIPSGAQ